MLFDGREFARRKKLALKSKLAKLDLSLSLRSVLVGDDSASVLYTKMKKKAAEEVGVRFVVERFSSSASEADIIRSIVDSKEDGIMVQLPLPQSLRMSTNNILDTIPNDKDVDGLKWEESGVMPATVSAVISIMDEIAIKVSDMWDRRVCVVGATGSVGRPLVHFLKLRGAEVVEVNSKTPDITSNVAGAGVVISAVGSPGVIKQKYMVEDVVAIDVGIEMVDGRAVGDMERDVYNDSLVAVPVPGGVGPATVVSLLENLYELSRRT